MIEIIVGIVIAGVIAWIVLHKNERWQVIKICSNCQKRLSEEDELADVCPYCGDPCLGMIKLEYSL